MKSVIGTLVAVVAVAGLFTVGTKAGIDTYKRFEDRKATLAAASAAAADRDKHERIVAWIVDRNPNATIKDFADFPRVLLVESAAAGIDYRIVMAMIDKESHFNPAAIGSSGEVGLMQILPSTAELVAKRIGMDFKHPVRNKSGSPTYSSLGTLGNPALNVKIGAAYLRFQVERYGMGPVALRAYNRNPDHATQNRPRDRYAEDIALKLVTIVQEFPR